MPTKADILDEIIRTAKDNGGVPLGVERFRSETGIKKSDWIGKFWARWGDALIEAGFEPNVFQGPSDDDELLEKLSSLTRDLGHVPVDSEIRLKVKSMPGFPWPQTFARFGNKYALISRLNDFCKVRGYEDVSAICASALSLLKKSNSEGEFAPITEREPDYGYVYLMKSGRYYKIGRSNSVGRRERELAIKLPEESKVVHSIKTDDPVGIEAYWHKRFGDRRKNGEWFELSAEDVSSFKRRKFM